MILSKKGKLEVEYIAIIVLALAVLLILILFSDKLRASIVEGVTQFFEEIIKGR